jgi:integrase
MAVRDKIVTENPASHLTYRKRKKPIRPTPTVEQFRQIVASVREQKFNGHDAEASGDLLEFLGLAGLGQAEAAAIKRSDVDLDAGRIIIYRHKTDQGFVIPIYPQVRPLIESCATARRTATACSRLIKHARHSTLRASGSAFRISRTDHSDGCSSVG